MSNATFDRGGWMIGRLLQGQPCETLPLGELADEWAAAADAIMANNDRATAWRVWCEGQPDGGQPYLAAVLRWAPGDPDPATVETGRRTRWTGRELLTTDFPDPVWIIPDILPAGLSILAGRPKVGKSWLALQWAHAIAAGGRVFDVPVKQKIVLYLALEDGPKGLAGRLTKQQADADHLDGLIFETEWPTFGTEGGRALLEGEIGRTGAGLVVVDTLSRALGGRADQMDIGDMTDHLGPLQKMAIESDTAILLVDHHRKSNGFEGDPIDDIMGSSAKAAVADAALGLYKQQGKKGAVLRIVGRELVGRDMALDFDGLTCTWQLLGDADDVLKGTFQDDILQAIRELETLGEPATTTNIAQHLDRTKSQVSHTLSDLLNGGRIVRGQKVGRDQPYQVTQDV